MLELGHVMMWRWIMDLGFGIDSLPDCNNAFDGSEEYGESFCAGLFVDAADGGDFEMCEVLCRWFVVGGFQDEVVYAVA